MKNGSSLQQLSTRTTAPTVQELARFSTSLKIQSRRKCNAEVFAVSALVLAFDFDQSERLNRCYRASGVRHDSEGGRRDTLFPNGYAFHWAFLGWRSLLPMVSFQNVCNSLIYRQIEANPMFM